MRRPGETQPDSLVCDSLRSNHRRLLGGFLGRRSIALCTATTTTPAAASAAAEPTTTLAELHRRTLVGDLRTDQFFPLRLLIGGEDFLHGFGLPLLHFFHALLA